MRLEQLLLAGALAVTGLFTGGSLFISIVDVPARRALAAASGREHFRQMYPRATSLQAPLAAGGAVLGIALWLLTGTAAPLAAAGCMAAVVAFTLIVIMPINHELMDSRNEMSDAQSSQLLDRWARMHAVRTVLGSVAYLMLLAF